MDKKKKIIIIVAVAIFVLLLGIGTSYAWFNFHQEGSNQRMIAADLYLYLNDGQNNLSISNIFPETKEEARARNDNTMTFSIYGKNTTDKVIYYEIKLNYGTAQASPMERFDDEDLRFDLIEVTEVNNEEVENYLLSDVGFEEINNTKIWVDTVVANTTTQIERTYRLRMWVADTVIISDSYPNADYTASDYKNHYASVKISVNSDLNLKSLPSNVITNDTFVENGKSYFTVDLSNDYLLEDEGKLLEENDTVRIVITNPENKLYFTYRDSEGNEVLTQNTSLDLTYTYNRNKTITIRVFTESKNDSNVSTYLNFEVYKNGTKEQEYTKQINVIGN